MFAEISFDFNFQQWLLIGGAILVLFFPKLKPIIGPILNIFKPKPDEPDKPGPLPFPLPFRGDPNTVCLGECSCCCENEEEHAAYRLLRDGPATRHIEKHQHEDKEKGNC